MTIRKVLSTAIVVGLSVPVLAQSGPRRDGNWEVTVEMSMPGMPAGMMQPMKMTQCVTPQDAQDPTKAVPRQNPDMGNCTVSDYKTEGNKVSWKMACTGKQKMTGTGEFTYSGDSYTGTMQMNMDGGNMPGAMTMKYSAKRLGDCTK